MAAKQNSGAACRQPASAGKPEAVCECRCRGPIHGVVRGLGWFLVAYGSVLMVAWHLHWIQLLVVGHTRTPIVYNTCLLLAAAGAGVLAANSCRFRATLAVGVRCFFLQAPFRRRTSSRSISGWTKL